MKKIFELLFVLCLSISCMACVPSKPAGFIEPVTQIRDDLLGTVIRISVYEDMPGAVFEDVFARIQDIDSRMAAAGTSEIARLNAGSGGSAVRLSPDTIFLIATAAEVSQKSGGAFDITVGPIVSLWDIGGDGQRVPLPEELSAATQLVDYRRLELIPDQSSARLITPGMTVVLGGIAKGYACDESVRVLREAGINRALIDLGGNVYALGTKPDGSLWNIGIRNPFIGEDGTVAALTVSDRSVVTSGGYERYFSDSGNTYHHILDPATGYPCDNGLLSVTIVSESSTLADALSTACFALGLEQGLALLEEYPDVQGVFITNDRNVVTTANIQDDFSLLDERFALQPYDGK